MSIRLIRFISINYKHTNSVIVIYAVAMLPVYLVTITYFEPSIIPKICMESFVVEHSYTYGHFAPTSWHVCKLCTVNLEIFVVKILS